MDGIHDLGGMEGFGPVRVRNGDANFADIEDWEKRMWAISCHQLVPGVTIDWFRHGIERMVPSDYLRFAYFNKWCTNFLMLMLDNGTITMEDVRRGHVNKPDKPAGPKSIEEVIEKNRQLDFSFETETLADAAYRVGQIVRAKHRTSSGHTRLPRYARDSQGTVIAHHGCHLLPDEGAKGNEVGDHLYTVCFSAIELWGPEANPLDTITLDLWESYLVPA